MIKKYFHSGNVVTLIIVVAGVAIASMFVIPWLMKAKAKVSGSTTA